MAFKRGGERVELHELLCLFALPSATSVKLLSCRDWWILGKFLARFGVRVRIGVLGQGWARKVSEQDP